MRWRFNAAGKCNCLLSSSLLPLVVERWKERERQVPKEKKRREGEEEEEEEESSSKHFMQSGGFCMVEGGRKKGRRCQLRSER